MDASKVKRRSLATLLGGGEEAFVSVVRVISDACTVKVNVKEKDCLLRERMRQATETESNCEREEEGRGKKGIVKVLKYRGREKEREKEREERIEVYHVAS